jgi:hypothetical protein
VCCVLGESGEGVGHSLRRLPNPPTHILMASPGEVHHATLLHAVAGRQCLASASWFYYLQSHRRTAHVFRSLYILLNCIKLLRFDRKCQAGQGWAPPWRSSTEPAWTRTDRVMVVFESTKMMGSVEHANGSSNSRERQEEVRITKSRLGY